MKEADLALYWDTVEENDGLDKIMVFVQESPLSGHRRWIHDNPDIFHTVVFHDPNPNKENQLHFSDNPTVFPWSPAIGWDIKREDTTLTNRIIFYAGAKKHPSYDTMPDKFNTIILAGLRTQTVKALSKYPNARIYGKGWEPEINAIYGKSTKTFDTRKGSWRRMKLEDVNDCGADFHLCIENCWQKNLITDHFHDGFVSDRIVLYLGCQNIEEYVPMDCFIDLRPYFDKEKKELDVAKIMERINTMTQEEYDAILKNARKWRKSLKGKTEIEMDKFTKRIIDRIKNGNKNI